MDKNVLDGSDIIAYTTEPGKVGRSWVKKLLTLRLWGRLQMEVKSDSTSSHWMGLIPKPSLPVSEGTELKWSRWSFWLQHSMFSWPSKAVIWMDISFLGGNLLWNSQPYPFAFHSLGCPLVLWLIKMAFKDPPSLWKEKQMAVQDRVC